MLRSFLVLGWYALWPITNCYYYYAPLQSLVQKFLEHATGEPMPATVDSAAIAGIMDLLHCQGCFALSIRYALCLGVKSSSMTFPPGVRLPKQSDYDKLADFFAAGLNHVLASKNLSPEQISVDPSKRDKLEFIIFSMLKLERDNNDDFGAVEPLLGIIKAHNDDEEDEEEGSNGTTLRALVRASIDAFFDNDLLQATRIFMANARGSFGVGVTSSLTADRQVCFAARGQTCSIAFYPKKGMILYGSEQAATKAGTTFQPPGLSHRKMKSTDDEDAAVRLDLDDLNGEICLLDWGPGEEPLISPPNRHLPVNLLMNNAVKVIVINEAQKRQSKKGLRQRMTLLEGHEFVLPLPPLMKDPILHDIQSIPSICRFIQDDWKGVISDNSSVMSLNRLTAWNLTKALKKRLQDLADGAIERGPGSIDILLTGCEVSLWVAEQFASDLQKAFPRLGIKAISSNKLLGLYGQELSVPAIGFPMSEKTHDLKHAIVIIVSHSGGTFAPLACSSLMQSFSENLFVVTSEWDTQVAKQLRAMHSGKYTFF